MFLKSIRAYVLVSPSVRLYTHMCVGVLQMSEEVIRSLGTGATGICEPSDTGSGILILVLRIK